MSADRPTILLTGVTGQVGWELQRTLASIGTVVGVSRAELDLASVGAIRARVREVKPDLIVNPAAYTAVDKAETDDATATAVNAVAPGILAGEAKRLGAALVHYSTDYVFDGAGSTPYAESDPTTPLGVYGRSKRAGEEAVLTSGAGVLVLRTSWVYSLRGHNFLLTMRRAAGERDRLRVVDDQVGAPTWSRLIAEATAQIVAQATGDLPGFLAERGGLYHLTCGGKTSWCGFARAILEADGSSTPVDPIATEEYPTPAPRPAYSVLDNRLLEERFGVRLPHWRDALELALAQ